MKLYGMNKKITLAVALGLVLLCSRAEAGPYFKAEPDVDGPDMVKEFGVISTTTEWNSPFGETEVKQTGGYLQVGYEFAPRWVGYGRIGVASFSADGGMAFTEETGNTETSDDAAPFFGLGIKGQIPLTRRISLHPYAEASRYSDYTCSNDTIISAMIFPPVVDQVPAQENLTIEKHYDLNAGLLLSLSYEGFVVYGGPTVYRRTAEVQGELVIDGDSYKREAYSFKEGGTVGGVAGLVIPLGETTDLFFELQQRSATSFTAGLVYLHLNF